MRVSAMLISTTRFVTLAATALAGVSLILMMLQTVADVVLRFLFNMPIEGNLEIVSYYHMVAVVFLPLGLVELRHEHINVDLFIAYLSRRNRNIFYVVASMIGIVFVSMLFYRSLLDAVTATRINDVIMGAVLITVWPAKWALPIGFGCLLLAIATNVVMALRNIGTYEPGADETR